MWVFYVFCMEILRAQSEGKMNFVLWLLAMPFVAAAIGLDVLLNYSLFALMTWDFPRKGEYTFSERLARLVKEQTWRRHVAMAIASILDPFDPTGRHIK